MWWFRKKGKNKMFEKYERLFIWDTETCGFSPEKDDILELSGILMERDETGKFVEKSIIDNLIQTSQTIMNSHIHGITNKMCKEEGITKQEMFNLVRPIFEDEKTLIIGHNVDYDIKMANGYFSKLDPTFRVKNDNLCTMLIMQDRIGGRKGSKLEDAVVKYAITGRDQAHRALSDVKDTYLVMKAMYKEKNDLEKFIRTAL